MFNATVRHCPSFEWVDIAYIFKIKLLKDRTIDFLARKFNQQERICHKERAFQDHNTAEKKQQDCWHLATDLLSTSRYQDAFAWLATACWRQVCCKLSQETCCKLIVETCYPQACCKLFEVLTSLQMISCTEPDFNSLILAKYSRLVKLATCNKSVAFSDIADEKRRLFPYHFYEKRNITLRRHFLPLNSVTKATSPCADVVTFSISPWA